MTRTIFKNARILTPSQGASKEPTFASAMLVKGDSIVQVGSLEDLPALEDTQIIDLDNRIVLPSFIDSHVHLLQYGLSLQKADLIKCTSLEQIQQTIRAFAQLHPTAPRLLCRGWIQSSTKGIALATMLDDIDPRPIYIDSFDLHSMWCNSAALDEMKAHTAPDLPGGTIHRDKNGRASGLLDESALFNLAWPFLESVTSLSDKLAALHTAVHAYTAAGYTGVIDMAMDDETWGILHLYRDQHGDFPFHIAVHWLIPFTNDEQAHFALVDRAITLHQQTQNEPRLYVTGIKLICDGVVDGCTAALSQPYSGQASPVDPIWPADMLSAVVSRADSAGLQCAIHAIGDLAIHQAINVLSQVGTPGRRHRIEHLELTSSEDAKRLGELGITASVQPVHSDPVLFRAWPRLIGEDRCQRAFAYREFLEGGAPLAIGTDAPTAAHFPFPNLYNATTRRSALEPEIEDTLNPQFGLTLAQAVAGATEGAAYSRFAEGWAGSLKEGFSADFVVVDMQWTAEKLLEGGICQTWYRGRKVFDVVNGEKV